MARIVRETSVGGYCDSRSLLSFSMQVVKLGSTTALLSSEVGTWSRLGQSVINLGVMT